LDIKNFSIDSKKRIENEIAEEFLLAQRGISRLPKNSRKGVQLALDYYKGLLKKITASPPEELLDRRIRISNLHKIRLFIANVVSPTYLKFQNA